MQFSNEISPDAEYMGFNYDDDTVNGLLDMSRTQLLDIFSDTIKTASGYSPGYASLFSPSLTEICMALQVQYTWYVSIHGVG